MTLDDKMIRKSRWEGWIGVAERRRRAGRSQAGIQVTVQGGVGRGSRSRWWGVPLVVWALGPGPAAATAQVPDSTDRALLAVVDASLETALRAPTPWPGYDAARRSLVVYRPGSWSVLLSPPDTEPSSPWSRYPGAWPSLPRSAWWNAGGDPGLVGQLGFDYDAPGGLVVAIPLYEDLGPDYGSGGAYLFSFLVHEAFHQYQRHRFADVETPSEERYPTLDPENNAMAALEFLALRDAVAASGGVDEDVARERARMAVAVHAERLSRLDDDARTIERSKEVVEGTAKYVETRFVASMARLCASGAVPHLESLCRSFEGLDAASWLADDFRRRLTDGAIAPADMARNRIYPVAAAVALLLDEYEPGWKSVVEGEGTTRGLFDHLAGVAAVSDAEGPALVAEARARYGWTTLLSSSAARVREYRESFDSAMARFDAGTGMRVTVSLPSSGVSRSRSSREQRWVVDAGRRTLGRFVVYTLRRRTDPALQLSLENVVVLDALSDDGRRSVTVHVPGSVVLVVDGDRLPAGFSGTRAFDRISFEATGAALSTTMGGTLAARAGELRIDLDASGG